MEEPAARLGARWPRGLRGGSRVMARRKRRGTALCTSENPSKERVGIGKGLVYIYTYIPVRRTCATRRG